MAGHEDAGAPLMAEPPGVAIGAAADGINFERILMMLQMQQQQIAQLMASMAANVAHKERRGEIRVPLPQLRGLERVGKFGGRFEDFEIWKEKLLAHLDAVPGVSDLMDWAAKEK